jgi:hypothetical protein
MAMERLVSLLGKAIAGVGSILLIALCAFAQKTPKFKKLYDGPQRPPSELVTIIVQDRHPLHAMNILINGKWVGLHDTSQVLPGSYVVSILSLCGHPPNAPASNPFVPFYSFYDYTNPFTATAGETVLYTIDLGNYPFLGLQPGTLCYGAVGAYHTVENSLQQPLDDDPAATTLLRYMSRDEAHAHTFRSLGPAAALVMNYLEAEGKGATDQVSAMEISSAALGDMTPKFAEQAKLAWVFSASNSKILSEEINEVAGSATVVAELVFTQAPRKFWDETHVFHLTMDHGTWKILKIDPW